MNVSSTCKSNNAAHYFSFSFSFSIHLTRIAARSFFITVLQSHNTFHWGRNDSDADFIKMGKKKFKFCLTRTFRCRTLLMFFMGNLFPLSLGPDKALKPTEQLVKQTILSKIEKKNSSPWTSKHIQSNAEQTHSVFTFHRSSLEQVKKTNDDRNKYVKSQHGQGQIFTFFFLILVRYSSMSV